MRKFIGLILVFCLIVEIDGRARRKRRQFSSASYYLAGVNPYANANVPVESLTYPSGSFYDRPNYIHSETSYGSNANYQLQTGVHQYAQQNPYGNFYSSNTQYQMIPGQYYDTSLYLYGPGGFNTRYPNWNQGNSFNYYTGGNGHGLSNTYNYMYRSFRPGALQAPIDGPAEQNLFAPMNNPPALRPPNGK